MFNKINGINNKSIIILLAILCILFSLFSIGYIGDRNSRVLTTKAINDSSDINNDGIVNIFDLSILLSNWNRIHDSSDINNDGIVNIFDLSILLSNWSIGNVQNCPDGTTGIYPDCNPIVINDFNPGNPNGKEPVPADMSLEDVSSPNHIIGNGTSTSCTSSAFLNAVNSGGIITFNCGPNPVTITLSETAKVKNSIPKLVIDGGGKVTLSGGGNKRIIYTDTCDESLGSVSGNCLYAPIYPKVTVQNITFADGNATNATYASPGDVGYGSNGGGAIFQLGGRLKVVRSKFIRNTCATNGPDLGGSAIRVLAQNSPTPNDLDYAYAARNQYPVAIVQSTFGGEAGQGGYCSNGGAISGLRTPITVINSLITHNNAIGCCSNPAWSGTPGGGSGGAIYTDGTIYDLKISGTLIENNSAKAGGSAIFYVSNDNSGKLYVTNSIIRNNKYAPNGLPNNPHFQNYPGIFYIGKGEPVFTGSTIAD